MKKLIFTICSFLFIMLLYIPVYAAAKSSSGYVLPSSILATALPGISTNKVVAMPYYALNKWLAKNDLKGIKETSLSSDGTFSISLDPSVSDNWMAILLDPSLTEHEIAPRYFTIVAASRPSIHRTKDKLKIRLVDLVATASDTDESLSSSTSMIDLDNSQFLQITKKDEDLNSFNTLYMSYNSETDKYYLARTDLINSPRLLEPAVPEERLLRATTEADNPDYTLNDVEDKTAEAPFVPPQPQAGRDSFGSGGSDNSPMLVRVGFFSGDEPHGDWKVNINDTTLVARDTTNPFSGPASEGVKLFIPAIKVKTKTSKVIIQIDVLWYFYDEVLGYVPTIPSDKDIMIRALNGEVQLGILGVRNMPKSKDKYEESKSLNLRMPPRASFKGKYAAKEIYVSYVLNGVIYRFTWDIR